MKTRLIFLTVFLTCFLFQLNTSSGQASGNKSKKQGEQRIKIPCERVDKTKGGSDFDTTLIPIFPNDELTQRDIEKENQIRKGLYSSIRIENDTPINVRISINGYDKGELEGHDSRDLELLSGGINILIKSLGGGFRWSWDGQTDGKYIFVLKNCP